MHLSLAKEHRDFFQSHGFIEFSALLSPSGLQSFADAVDTAVLKRQTIPCSSSERERSFGRDLWRDEPGIKKVSLNRDFAEVAAELTKQKRVRTAYDQNISLQKGVNPRLPTGMISLQEMSSIKPIISGLLIRLSSGEMPNLRDVTLPCPCPSLPGNGLFFSAQLLLSWAPLLSMSNEHFFLIAYTDRRPRYLLEKRDPCTHALKKLGYGFGDALRTDTHPFLY